MLFIQGYMKLYFRAYVVLSSYKASVPTLKGVDTGVY